jgi:GT2 family glycosyltransferase
MLIITPDNIMPNTAVVLLNWNGKHFLERFLPSIVQYTPIDEADIIIADNGSSDDSVNYLQDKWPALRRIVLGKNYGFADGYNRALKQLPDYTFFILLNTDIEVRQNWLNPLIKHLHSNPKNAACMPKIRSLAEPDKFEYAGGAGGYIDMYGYPFCKGRIFDTIEEDRGQYDEPSDIFWATGACLAIRADCFFMAGGFDPDFFAHQEEIDLCWRLQNAGFKIGSVPQSVVFHVGGGTLPKENPQKTFLNFRNGLLLLYKNLPAEKVYFVLFIRMSLDFISAFRFFIRGDLKNTMAIWRAHQGFYSQLKKYRTSGAEMQRPPLRMNVIGIYQRSIVWDFFILRRKTFDLLRFPDKRTSS